MKNLIKGLLDNGHKVSVWKKNGIYVFDVDDKQFTISFDKWEKAEETILDYFINEADL